MGTHAVHVVDESGGPVAGAIVQSVTPHKHCGPSRLPEGCGYEAIKSPAVATDAAGVAAVCTVDERTEIFVTYRDWPTARTTAHDSDNVVVGPARQVIAALDAACGAGGHVHVRAYGDAAGQLVWARPLADGLSDSRFALTLGPWRYWVASTDDRSGNSATEAASCPAYVRSVDAAAEPTVVLDRSDAVIDFPSFAGATATVTRFRESEPVATTTLDARGRATLALPATSGTTYCLRLSTPDHCARTFARAGEIARAGLYAGREREIEASCGVCPP